MFISCWASPISWRTFPIHRLCQLSTSTVRSERCLTCELLLTVAGNGADDGVLLATKAVGSALDVGLGLGGLVFDLALGVLLLA